MDKKLIANLCEECIAGLERCGYVIEEHQLNDILQISKDESQFSFQFNFPCPGFFAVIETDLGEDKGFRTVLCSPFQFLATSEDVQTGPFSITAANCGSAFEALVNCFRFSFFHQASSTEIFHVSFPVDNPCQFQPESECDCSLQITDAILNTNICSGCNLISSTLSTPFFTATEIDPPICDYNFETQMGDFQVTGSGISSLQLPATFVLDVSKTIDSSSFNGYKLVVTDAQGSIEIVQSLSFQDIIVGDCS